MLKYEYFSGFSQLFSAASYLETAHVNIKEGMFSDNKTIWVIYYSKNNIKESGLTTYSTWESFCQGLKDSKQEMTKDLLGLVRLNYMIGEQRVKV